VAAVGPGEGSETSIPLLASGSAAASGTLRPTSTNPAGNLAKSE